MMALFRNTTAARAFAAAPQPANVVQEYRNIERHNISSNDKQTTATEILRLAASSNPRDKKFATGIVRDLMDFKAAEYQKKQSRMQSALGSLRQRFQSPPNGAQVTYDACVMLVKNRSSIFKSKLPDTARKLVEAMLEIHLPLPGIVSDANKDFLGTCNLAQKVNRTEERQLIDKCLQDFFEACTSGNDKHWNAMAQTSRSYYRYISHADALNLIGKDVARDLVETRAFFCHQPARVGGASGTDSMLLIASDWVRQQDELDVGLQGVLPDRKFNELHLRSQPRHFKGSLKGDLLDNLDFSNGAALRLPIGVDNSRRLGGTSVTVSPHAIAALENVGCWRHYERRGVRPARDIESVGGLCTAMCLVGLSQTFCRCRGMAMDVLPGLVLHRSQKEGLLREQGRLRYENSKEELRNGGWPGFDSTIFLESRHASIRTICFSCDGGNVGSSFFWYNTLFLIEGGEEGRRWRRFVKYSVPVTVSFRGAGAYYSLAGATSRATLVSVSQSPFEGTGIMGSDAFIEW
jgi:hypothetical protein